MRLSLKKAAYVAAASATREEIRVHGMTKGRVAFPFGICKRLKEL
jgi:hypothetical protein